MTGIGIYDVCSNIISYFTISVNSFTKNAKMTQITHILNSYIYTLVHTILDIYSTTDETRKRSSTKFLKILRNFKNIII